MVATLTTFSLVMLLIAALLVVVLISWVTFMATRN